MCDLLAAWAFDPPAEPPAWPAAAWDALLAAAEVHGVTALLERRLGALPGWRGGAAASLLAGRYAANCRRIARLQQDLRAILGRFAAAGVRLMPLKGAVLTAGTWPDPGERPMADLDLLVHGEDLETGVALLGEVGYEVVFRGHKHVKLGPAGGDDLLAAGEHADNPRWVELHPACGEWLDEDRIELTGPIWESAREGRLLGEPAWLPHPAMHWLYLLVHATHHILINRFRLVQLLDLLLLEPALPADGVLAFEELEGPEDAAPRATDPAASMARALYAPLALLDRYAYARGRGVRGELRERLREHLSPGFLHWADRLSLYRCCYLDVQPWRPE
jgi:hypothetical protein